MKTRTIYDMESVSSDELAELIEKIGHISENVFLVKSGGGQYYRIDRAYLDDSDDLIIEFTET